jgi:hypothetical protein
VRASVSSTVGRPRDCAGFTNDEGFYEFQDEKWFRNRFRAGANLKLGKRTDLQVFYQRQDSNNSTPGAINALGLTADVTFE